MSNALLSNPEFSLALAPRTSDIRTLNAVFDELTKARAKHISVVSHHEAYAVILEELDEYWDEVKAQHRKPDKIRAELIQVAAMAIRTIVDLEAANDHD